MPNYTGTNGPQYGVTGYPQGTVPPSQSRYTGFNPLWSRNTSYSGGPATPGTPGVNGYGTAPAQVPTYGTPTGQGPAYGTRPAQGPTYSYGTQPGQATPYGYGGQTPVGGYGLRVPRGRPMARKAVTRGMEQHPPRRPSTHRSARLPANRAVHPTTSQRMRVPRTCWCGAHAYLLGSYCASRRARSAST